MVWNISDYLQSHHGSISVKCPHIEQHLSRLKREQEGTRSRHLQVIITCTSTERLNAFEINRENIHAPNLCVLNTHTHRSVDFFIGSYLLLSLTAATSRQFVTGCARQVASSQVRTPCRNHNMSRSILPKPFQNKAKQCTLFSTPKLGLTEVKNASQECWVPEAARQAGFLS